MADERVWKPLELIKVTADYLATKNVPGPRLDAEVLLCAVLGLKRRVDLYAGFETEISGKNLAAYRELVRRRTLREPVSRILGRREFMGIEFAVTPDVLSPRPETELLVEAVLECVNPKKNTLPPDEEETAAMAEMLSDDEQEGDGDDALLAQLLDSYGEDVENEDDIDAPVKPTRQKISAPPPAPAPPQKRGKAAAPAAARASVLDLGTGSGCVAVAVAAQLSAARVVAVDASPKALAVAKKNAAAANVAERVDFRCGDWFAGCRTGEVFDCIVSNPPYLVEGDPAIWPEVAQYDPPAALYGGRDGLDCYRRIVPDAPLWLAPQGWLFLEVGAEQAKRVAEMLARRGFREVGIVADYGGIERVVKGRAPLA
jgi:release factor glutamine methyltransferase